MAAIVNPFKPAPFKLTNKQAAAQMVMAGAQRHTLIVGGSRSGKTFLLVRAVVIRAMRAPGSRHAIFRFRGNSVWAAIGLDTLPKVMRMCYPGVALTQHKQDGYFSFPNGSQIWLGGLDDKERAEKILGQEYATIYFNEASQIPYSSYLIAKTRLAQVCVTKPDGKELKQREYVDLNPSGTGHWTYRQFILKIDPDGRKPLSNPEQYDHFYINPADNADNLSPDYLIALQGMPEKQRRRFFDGKYISDIDGALWKLEDIDGGRIDEVDLPEMARIVVAVDPSGTSGKDDNRSDDVGIVIAGKGYDGHAYILADWTCNLSPSGWGARAAEAYHRFQANCIIAERNFGGSMVEFVIMTADSQVPFKEVTASRGKAVRAEPISLLYERGKVHHVGRFPELEDQMSNFSTSGYMGAKSPDRADALVWALSDLMLDNLTGLDMWEKLAG